MRSYGYGTVVAVGKLMPDMLNAVLLKSLVVALGSVAYSTVKPRAGYHKHIWARS